MHLQDEGVSDGTNAHGVSIEHVGGDDCQSRSIPKASGA